ncbi:MAG: sigma 54-interacting transcriptional regulator [Desulfobacterales bacterium]|jgi:PAS domain S-box-containing protein|nr:sigma 54-interacting transcriptional regulator [Desulfobacterales bacterium]
MPDISDTADIDELRRQLEIYQLIFESIHSGAMVTDAEGRITHFNRFYGQFLGCDPAAQIGRHCSESVENSRMHIVAQTGKAEINHSQLIQGQKMVVQRIPIKKDGKVIAVFGQVMFKDVRDVGKLARELSLLESKLKLYEEELITLRSTRYTFESIVGESRELLGLKQEALKASGNSFPVLITGESGTGKELFAQAIHNAGTRRLHPFVRINCAAIPRDLLESELFGYEKGAFTGARAEGKPGKFELADEGTIFLDEIGDMPIEMQPKLLRAIEDKEFERVGGNRVARSDFRVIAATNQNLESLLEAGRFRKDLFYRLNVVALHIPPLRERPADVVAITRRFLDQTAREAGYQRLAIDREAEQALCRCEWPGNVRELTNVLGRSVSALEGDTIRLADLPLYVQRGRRGASVRRSATSLREMQSHAERETLLSALRETGFNKVHAARLLGIHRTLLYKKMRKHNLPLKAV